MSSQPDSPASISLEQQTTAENATIPLPAVSRTPVAETQSRGSRAGLWLIPLVLILAFLAVSFPARNSDLWLHLASGRLRAEGKATFGTDPFAYTTTQVYWTNHSWLFDRILYWLYGRIGGTGLVILKAVVAAALTCLLLSIRRSGSSFYLPVVCTTLAIVAAGRHVLVQPTAVSYFLLGWTLWLLWKQHSDDAQSATRPLTGARCLLLAICAIWANSDEWFFLGPLLIALFWLGGRLEGKPRIPAWLVPAALAACLLNPHTYHVFMLPSEISPATWASGIRNDVRYQTIFSSPWPEWWTSAKGLNGVDLAYFGLMLLGILSFILNLQGLRGWRLVVWLPFAALAAWQARFIVFFAVVAAPITALNLQDFLAARESARTGRQGDKETRNSSEEVAILVYSFACILFFALLGLSAVAWLGGISGYAREERHVAWSVQPDPSLRQVAEVLRMWRSEGLLKEHERVLALTPEMAAYSAWFGSGEKQFFDQRYPLFAQVASDYDSVFQALQAEPAESRKAQSRSEAGRGKNWTEVFNEYGIAIVVFHDRAPRRLSRVLSRLAADPAHWTVLSIAGQSLIVGWNEARPPGGFAALAFDPDRLAFGPQNERENREAPAAPERGPDSLPERRNIVDRLISSPPPPPTWESAAAIIYGNYYIDSPEDSRRRQLRDSWSLFVGGLTGLPALPGGLPQAGAQLYSARNMPFRRDVTLKQLTLEELGPYFARSVERSPALPLLVVRAARRAVAVNPSDADAWLRLGLAYLTLFNDTRGRHDEGVLPPLAEIRYVQIAAALEQALRLNPDLEDAHHQLYFLFGQLNFLDQALEHGREDLRLTRRAGRRPGESEEEYADRLEFLQKDTDKLAEIVRDGQAKYASASPSLQGDRLALANMALKLGLGRQAVEGVLWSSSPDVLGYPGMKLEIEMLLRLGRMEDVRPILSNRGVRANKQNLGQSTVGVPRGPDKRSLYAVPYRWAAYEWLHLLQSAAIGDYARAQEDLQALRAELAYAREEIQKQLLKFENRLWTFIPGLVSGPSPILPTMTALELRRALNEKQFIELSGLSIRAQLADLITVEGLLALEQGNSEAAYLLFEQARALDSADSNLSVPSAGGRIAAYYLGKTKAQR
jgi:hypothetical protein